MATVVSILLYKHDFFQINEVSSEREWSYIKGRQGETTLHTIGHK